jgi:hypothetical protein
MELTSPEVDQLEVSVFGPGYGECIVAHLGDNAWMVVDSLLDEHNEPVALRYLSALGVDPANVKLLVASHWDQDHIRGFSKLAEKCIDARVFISSALQTQQFMAFADKMSAYGTERISSTVKELIQMLTVLKAQGRVGRLASVDKLMYASNAGDNSFGVDVSVSALSPGHGDVEAFLKRLGDYAFPVEGSAVLRPMPFTNNDASVVAVISFGDLHILLGGDLENRTDLERGWNSVLDSQTALGKKASVFKVSHHGSQNGHEPRVWSELLENHSIAVIAPWKLGGGFLPKVEDLDRLLALTDKVFVTTLPSSGKMVGKGSIVQSEMRNHGIKTTSTYKKVGQVRLRRKLEEGDWQVELLEPACLGTTYSKHLVAA